MTKPLLKTKLYQTEIEEAVLFVHPAVSRQVSSAVWADAPYFIIERFIEHATQPVRELLRRGIRNELRQ